jgi:hypothetical protein
LIVSADSTPPADDERIPPLTAQQLGLCGPRSDDPGVGPDAARHTPPGDDQAARVREFAINIAQGMTHPRQVLCPAAIEGHPWFLVDSDESIACPWCEVDAFRDQVHEVMKALNAEGDDPVSAASFVRQAADAFAAKVAGLEEELVGARSQNDRYEGAIAELSDQRVWLSGLLRGMACRATSLRSTREAEIDRLQAGLRDENGDAWARLNAVRVAVDAWREHLGGGTATPDEAAVLWSVLARLRAVLEGPADPGLSVPPNVGQTLHGPAEAPGLPPASEWEQQMRAFLGKRVEVVLSEDPRKVVVGVLHGFDTDGQVRIADEDGSWGWAWPCLDIAVSVGPAEATEPARTVNPELEVGASEVGTPGPHLVGADTPAMSMLLRRVQEGMWTAEEAQATLLTWPNRAGATDATTGDAIAELVRRADTATAERDQLRHDMENTRLATDERVRDIQAETVRREAGLFRALWRAIGRAPGTEKDLLSALHQLAALAGPATPTEETS